VEVTRGGGIARRAGVLVQPLPNTVGKWEEFLAQDVLEDASELQRDVRVQVR